MRDAARPSPRPAKRPGADPKGRLGPGADLRLCLTSVPSRHAARLADLLVTARVAACVSILPGVVSVYRWKGKFERAREVLLLVKTSATAAKRCAALLAAAHPYDVPEILVAIPEQAAEAYAAWLRAETA